LFLGRTLVVRLHKCAQLPKALTALFQKPGFIFTGVNIASDFSKLFADFVDETHELAELEAKITNDAVDLLAMATRILHLDARLWSLQKLVSVVLGKHLNKEIDHRQWANENLTDYQIKYAVNDAAAHFNVYQALETNRQPLEPDSKDSPSPDSKFDDAKFDDANELRKHSLLLTTCWALKSSALTRTKQSGFSSLILSILSSTRRNAWIVSLSAGLGSASRTSTPFTHHGLGLVSGSGKLSGLMSGLGQLSVSVPVSLLITLITPRPRPTMTSRA
jgi:hypothetical protein